MTPPTPFRIAMVGGGIGGLFAALCIHFHCQARSKTHPIQIDVYEQASQYKEIGAGVGIGVNAARLVHKLGLGDRLNAIAGHRSGVWVSFRRFDNGEDIVTVPANDSGTVRQAPCARSDFLDLLKSAVEERAAATLHTKKVFQKLEDQGSSVLIHFGDGTSAEANVVIGCDGIHSTIRHQFVTDKAMYSGQIAYRGIVPVASLEDWPFESWSVAWLAKHRHFLVFPISSNQELNIVAFVTKSEGKVADVKESWTTVCERAEVEQDFAEFEPTAQKIISLMPKFPSRWRINDREPLNQWHFLEGKAILLGDAAHAMLPHLGAGAGQAMEDGWALGRALSSFFSGDLDDISRPLEAAAQLYQDTRLSRAQRAQATSRVAGNTYELQTEDMLGLTFEQCCPIVAERTAERMKWVWEEDLDVRFDEVQAASLSKA